MRMQAMEASVGSAESRQRDSTELGHPLTIQLP